MMPVILLMIVLFDKLRHQPAPLPAVGHWDETRAQIITRVVNLH